MLTFTHPIEPDSKPKWHKWLTVDEDNTRPLRKVHWKSTGGHTRSIYAQDYRPWIKEAVSQWDPQSCPRRTKFGRKARNFNKHTSVSRIIWYQIVSRVYDEQEAQRPPAIVWGW